MTKRSNAFLLSAGVLFIMLAVALILITPFPSAPEDPIALPSAVHQIEGVVAARSLAEQFLILSEGENVWKVVADSSTSVEERWGPQSQSMSFADIVPGAALAVEGGAEGKLLFIATHIRIVSTPNIVILTPQPEERVSPQFQIRGVSRTFENNVQYRVLTEDDKELAQGFTTAMGPDIGHYALFDPMVDVVDYTGPAIVEVFEYSAKDGSVINLASIPVSIDGGYHAETIYFSNLYKDIETLRCEETYPVARQVRTLQLLRAPDPEEIVKERLASFFEGVSASEEAEGYFTSIPQQVTVEDVIFNGSTVRIQLSDTLEQGVAGSCRVMAIRSQIENTVKAAVEGAAEVEIALGDRVEDVLQP